MDKDNLLQEIMTMLETDKFGDLNLIQNKLAAILQDYDISKTCTDIVLYGDVIPNAAKAYIISRAIEGLAPSTQERYMLILTNFFKIVRRPLNEIDTNTIRYYLYYQKNTGNICDRTLEGYRICINTFFQWCVDNEYLLRNPAAKIAHIKFAAPRKDYLTKEELEEVRDRWLNLRDRVIVEMYYSTAMRCTELTNVKISDINMDNRTVQVWNQKSQRYKICFISEKCLYWLKKYLPTRDPNNDYLIQSVRSPHNKLTKAGIERAVRAIGDRCSFDKRLTPNVFRHSLATHALAAEVPLVDVQMMLDHKSPKTTLVYAERQNKAVQMSHARAVA